MRAWPIVIFAAGSWISTVSLAAAQARDGGRQWPGRQPGQVFISPAGQAFRAPFGGPYPVATWFAQADLDHDGHLDRNEFEQDFKRFFDQLDVEHQGALSGIDIQRYEDQIVPEVASRGDTAPGVGGSYGGQHNGGRRGGGGRGGWGGHGGHRGDGSQRSGGDAGHAEGTYDLSTIGAARYSLIAIPEPVASMDTNMDGLVTPDEVEAAADRRFDELDQAGRGYLLLKDLPETPAERHHGRWHSKRHGHHGIAGADDG